jgi:hypothetical protein
MITMTDQIRKFINSIPKLPEDKPIISKKDNDNTHDNDKDKDKDESIMDCEKISVIVKI